MSSIIQDRKWITEPFAYPFKLYSPSYIQKYLLYWNLCASACWISSYFVIVEIHMTLNNMVFFLHILKLPQHITTLFFLSLLYLFNIIAEKHPYLELLFTSFHFILFHFTSFHLHCCVGLFISAHNYLSLFFWWGYRLPPAHTPLKFVFIKAWLHINLLVHSFLG